MRFYFLVTLFVLCLYNNSKGQSIGINLINHFSFNRDVVYSPGLGLTFEVELSKKIDMAASVMYGENLGDRHYTEYTLDFKRSLFKLDLYYVFMEDNFKRIKAGISPSYEFESFHQTGRKGRRTEDFTNKGVGIGIPVLFQSNGLAKSSLMFNISVTPVYLILMEQEGKNAEIFTGNREDDIYIDLSIGIAYRVK